MDWWLILVIWSPSFQYANNGCPTIASHRYSVQVIKWWTWIMTVTVMKTASCTPLREPIPAKNWAPCILNEYERHWINTHKQALRSMITWLFALNFLFTFHSFNHSYCTLHKNMDKHQQQPSLTLLQFLASCRFLSLLFSMLLLVFSLFNFQNQQREEKWRKSLILHWIRNIYKERLKGIVQLSTLTKESWTIWRHTMNWDTTFHHQDGTQRRANGEECACDGGCTTARQWREREYWKEEPRIPNVRIESVESAVYSVVYCALIVLVFLCIK